MTPVDALKLLGSKRVIWIDDRFAIASPERLIELLIANAEDIEELCPRPIQDALAMVVSDDEIGIHDLQQAVADLTEPERIDLLRKVQQKLEDNGTAELSDDQINSVCAHLQIAKEDCWPFEQAEAAMLDLVKDGGDAEISYIIDLNDVQGTADNTRGLELLKALHGAGSKATALLLTHYATKSNEAEKELELRDVLLQDGRLDVSPICVIAKERLYPEGDTVMSVAEQDSIVASALRIAIKRAGLRRNVHEVLMRVHGHIDQAFKNASNDLLEIPPEQLEEYVVERAYAEGVSELHVVERALTASMSESFRQMFSVNPDTRENERRLRSLREVPLGLDVTVHHKKLEAFRTQEVWEPEELVNKAYSPLACGDVFEMDAQHDMPACRFILLVQPCDVMLRPNGSRDSDAGFLVVLKQLESINDPINQKQIRLPFLLGGRQWVCELRKTTSVRLELLDLVSYRADGRLEYQDGQVVPPCLLPGQQVSAKSVFAALSKALKTRQDAVAALPKEMKDARCQLTLSAKGPFRYIAHETFIKAAAENVPAVKASFTWNLRRIGRVRMPYASALLGSYLAVVDRDAFDLDYLRQRTSNMPNTPVCGPCS